MREAASSDPLADWTLEDENFIDHFPKVYHYTKLSALRQIILGKQLFATDFHYLNDSAEFTHFAPQVTDIISSAFKRFLNKKQRVDVKLRKFLKDNGGLDHVAAMEGEKFIKSIYNLSDKIGRPFIVSFCTHTSSEEEQDGLLSLWRNYGDDGGYCIEIESKSLVDSAFKGIEKLRQSGSQISDVVYSDDEPRIAQWRERLKRMDRAVGHILHATSDGHLGERDETAIAGAIHIFRGAACRFKHAGFKDEKEARLVVFRMALDDGQEKPEFKVEYREKAETLIPYIAVPIGFSVRRIIVGPHPNASVRASSLRQWLNDIGEKQVEVSVSQIPYRSI